MPVKTCVVCGSEFDGSAKQILCSKQCVRERCNRLTSDSRRLPPKEIECVVCGRTAVFSGPGSAHRTTCSPECQKSLRLSRNASWKRKDRAEKRGKLPICRECKWCGNILSDDQGAHPSRRYCSNQCKTDFRRHAETPELAEIRKARARMRYTKMRAKVRADPITLEKVRRRERERYHRKMAIPEEKEKRLIYDRERMRKRKAKAREQRRMERAMVAFHDAKQILKKEPIN